MHTAEEPSEARGRGSMAKVPIPNVSKAGVLHCILSPLRQVRLRHVRPWQWWNGLERSSARCSELSASN